MPSPERIGHFDSEKARFKVKKVKISVFFEIFSLKNWSIVLRMPSRVHPHLRGAENTEGPAATASSAAEGEDKLAAVDRTRPGRGRAGYKL